jgi:alkylhydroperoxidase family enzyme
MSRIQPVDPRQYCVSAHTAIGRKAGLAQEEMVLNRRGGSSDARAAAAVAFARALNENRGAVTAAELEAVRRAGYGDAEIAEIIAIVTLNFFTNLVGKAAQLDIDFPKVALLEAAA